MSALAAWSASPLAVAFATAAALAMAPWQCLNFLPEPQRQNTLPETSPVGLRDHSN